MDKLSSAAAAGSQGEVAISGAKNAALPELCAALLTDEPVTLVNVPQLQDVSTTLKLLRNMGVGAERSDADSRTRHARRRRRSHRARRRTSWSRRCARRSSCSGRCWRASARRACRCPAAARSARGRSTSTSRACRRWAPRSASSTATSSRSAPSGLKGARITTDMVTVTGTENLLMAATLAEGETVLENAAQEPEIADLAEMLIAMGATIEGHGTSRIRIQGVERAARPGGARAPHRAGPHRGRHLPVRGRGDRRRRRAARRARRPPRRRDRQAARGRRDDRGRRRLDPRARRRAAEGGELPHQRVPGLPDRHAGAVHGARLHRRGLGQGHRDDLREPLHARQRAGAPRREHRDRRPHGARARRRRACPARP